MNLKVTEFAWKVHEIVTMIPAAVEATLKNDVESCLRVTATAAMSNQVQLPLHACKLSSVVHLIFPKIKRFVFNRFIRDKIFFLFIS